MVGFVNVSGVAGKTARPLRASSVSNRNGVSSISSVSRVRSSSKVISMSFSNEPESKSVLNLVQIAEGIISDNMNNGKFDLKLVQSQLSTLLRHELVRSKELMDTLISGLYGLINGKNISMKTRHAAAALLASLTVFVAMNSVGEALAIDTTMNPPVMVESTEQLTPTATQTQSNGVQDWRYSEFLKAIQENKVEKVTFSANGQQVLAVDSDGNRFKLEALPNDPDLLKELTEHKVDVTVLPVQEANGAAGFLQSLIFPAILFGGLFLLSRNAGGGGGMPGGMGGGPMDLGKSGARMNMIPDTNTTFNDVAGCDQAKLELEEVVQFLKEAERFTKIGAKIPKGVILEGPPGTGKTLLARAIAGEAGVPFFSISGSEFVEMFVGVGAARVRDLFAQAKKNAPCIIFIDEIDAVGRQRGAGIAGGNDEREQTLNQMLVEMDGFEKNNGIIVVAATNRSDVLDQALLRPGRFDRRIIVDLPDFKGRCAILEVHCRGKPLGADVDVEQIARRAPGFSGAQLQNLMNEAAIFAARREKKTIEMDEIESALERIMLGPEKKSQEISDRRRELTAYHEAGHAIVGAMTAEYDQVAKVTIVPRGGAGGLTFFAPSEQRLDTGLYSRQFLEGQLAVALGGRVAEELIYGMSEVTTGASNDFQQVSRTARMMVTRFGFSDKIGQIAVENDGGSPFMGRQMAQQSMPLSRQTQDLIDEEVQRLVEGAYERAKNVLTENRGLLEKLTQRLLETETVTAEEFQKMIAEDEKVKMIPYAVLN
eukprot:CAMPEP_0182441496 /NCGR_PEP_ID=MMETSP1172-20130603/461_1 /TAXON_ID=708627 /ORGANISM="Timspurckia oligopyrenoides, Strain CCMP3278" /LENGTH=767 /DNA_ID=CAMNT_0024635825 /DNA_START=24 /DNA_END=2327 /DNA_ORIENTATION=+